MEKEESKNKNKINIDILKVITYSDLESEFEYDESKSRSNEEKHGIDFKEAQRLWDGVYVKLNARKRGERRFLYIGVIDGRHWTVVVTMRGGKKRIISARKSTKSEVKLYVKKNYGG